MKSKATNAVGPSGGYMELYYRLGKRVVTVIVGKYAGERKWSWQIFDEGEGMPFRSGKSKTLDAALAQCQKAAV